VCVGAAGAGSGAINPNHNHMNAALEFHDSKVQQICSVDDTLRIIFSAAYIHRSQGRPGIDAGIGYTQRVEIVFSGASWSETISECRGAISDGELSINGEVHSLISVPLFALGAISANFIFVSGVHFTVRASAVTCSCLGDPQFVENSST
jgi:hypothetical protein